jgi:hypothetical protein
MMTDDLEAAVMRKVAWRLVPLLGLCYFINVMDRFNVSVAALTMNQALGLSATTYGLGAGAFFWSYVLFQVPANAALKRVGARRWITLIAVAWGLCSAGTALATGVTTFVLARFLLGVAEAGFFPGVAFFMTCWFPSRYRGRAMGIFFALGASAGASSVRYRPTCWGSMDGSASPDGSGCSSQRGCLPSRWQRCAPSCCAMGRPTVSGCPCRNANGSKPSCKANATRLSAATCEQPGRSSARSWLC